MGYNCEIGIPFKKALKDNHSDIILKMDIFHSQVMCSLNLS